ncbi:hypothetical protein [Nocardia yunnanensis]|nr:hypothetical protein [Nocardia yunnanensis]
MTTDTAPARKLVRRWQATREWRRGIAILLAFLGMLGWGMETLLALFDTTEPKFDDMGYLGTTAVDVFVTAALCFGLLTVLLGGGAVLLMCRLRLGRYLLIGTSALVLAGQALALTLAAIPIDDFSNQPPPSMAFNGWLTIFPLATLVLLLGKQREH